MRVYWNRSEHANSGRQWSEGDIQFVRDSVGLMGVRKCAEKLGRTESSIRSMMRREDIRVSKSWKLSDLKYIAENYETKGAKHCAERLGASVGTVIAYAYKMRKKGELK